MDFAPSYAAWARATAVKDGKIKTAELVNIRKLYLTKRYKQCIEACDECLKHELHPVDKAFLLFQQALSHEEMGLTAHKYSKRKIPFLESAEAEYMAVMEVLGGAVGAGLFTDDDNADNDNDNGNAEHDYDDMPSPSSVFEMENTDAGGGGGGAAPAAADNWTPTHLPREGPVSHEEPKFSDSSSLYSYLFEEILTPHEYFSRKNRFPQTRCIPRTVTVEFTDVDMQDLDFSSDSDSDSNPDAYSRISDVSRADHRHHVSRLAASLSSMHVLADELVPEPLFGSSSINGSIKGSTRSDGGEENDVEMNEPFSSPMRIVNATLDSPPPHEPRLVPSQPNQKPQTPQNYQTSTPRQLLPSPFEDSPLSGYTDASIATSSLATITPGGREPVSTPVSPRFAFIRSIFTHPPPQPNFPRRDDHDGDDTHMDEDNDDGPYSSPRSTVSQALSAPLSRHSQSQSSAQMTLNDFLASVKTAIRSVQAMICNAREVQDEHEASKRRNLMASRLESSQFMASYWLLQVPSSPTELSKRGRMSLREKHATYTRSRYAKDHATEDEEDKEKAKEKAKEDNKQDGEGAKQRKQERMNKLRTQGWKVRKENFGWKGEQHYDNLVREAEFESRPGVGGVGMKGVSAKCAAAKTGSLAY